MRSTPSFAGCSAGTKTPAASRLCPPGNTLLADAKRRVGDRLFLKGNMDSVNMLLTATPDILEDYVQAMIRDGGYILSSACSVAPGVDFELLKRLVPLAEKYGRYSA